MFLTIVTIPHVVFYVLGGTQDYQDTKTITAFFGLTTLGNLGSPYNTCQYTTSFTSSLSLYWNYGTLYSVGKFGKEKSDGSSSCSDNGANLSVDSNCDYSSFSSTYKSNLETAFKSQWYKKDVCTFDLSGISFPSGWSGKPYIKVSCQSNDIAGVSKSDISLILVIFDIIAMLVFYIALMIHRKYEDIEECEINESVLDGSDFTVMIKNVPQNQDQRILMGRLWQHIEQVLEEFKDRKIRIKDDPNALKVADINFGMGDYEILGFYMKRSELIKQETILTIKMDIVKDSKMKENDKEKTCAKMQKQIDKIQKKKEKNEEGYEKFKQKSKQEVVKKTFVTFKSMEGKLRFLDLYNVGRWRRWRRKPYASRYFEGRWLDVRQPPPASLILWENLGVGKTERFFRILLVSLVSFLLMILWFIVIVYSRDYQSTLSSKYGDKSWPKTTITQTEAYNDYQKSESQRLGLMSCYCSQEFKKSGYNVSNIQFSDSKYYWNDWIYTYSVSNAFIWFMVFMLSVMNVILKTILRLFSAWERRHDKTDLVISNTFKMFVVQFVNTAIIILIVNAKFDFMPSWSPILNGEYDDFSTEWYKHIGVSIILTMLIGVFSPHIANGLFFLQGAWKRVWDRKCSWDKRKTKQLYQADYENMYMGPELMFEYRYSTMMNTVYISLMFGSGMPLLYFFGFVSFFLTYWVDKFAFLRIYQTPPRYNKDLMRTTRESLYVSIFIHFLFGFWMYSNSVIFETSSQEIFGINVASTTATIEQKYPWLKIQERLAQYHSFIYFIGIVIFIIIFLVRLLLIKTIIKIFSCCWRNKTQEEIDLIENSQSVFSTNYYLGLDKTDRHSCTTKLEDDIHKYKRYKENEFKAFSEYDLGWIEWFISRMKSKREEVHEAFNSDEIGNKSNIAMSNLYESTRAGTKIGLYDLKDIKITDPSYDVRDLKPYKYFISKMEKDLEDIEYRSKEVDQMINTEHQDIERQNNNDIKIEDVSEEVKVNKEN